MAAVAALIIGAGLGLMTGKRVVAVAPAPAPVVLVVTNTLEVPVPVAAVAAPAASEFDGLKDKGLGVTVGKDSFLQVTFDEPAFSSRATLDPDRAELLEAVADVLVKHSGDWHVTIVGHTDAIPPRATGPYRDNRELGLARATEGLRFLMRHDVPAAMLEAATAGEENPPFPGDSPGTRIKNRTITLRIRAVN